MAAHGVMAALLAEWDSAIFHRFRQFRWHIGGAHLLLPWRIFRILSEASNLLTSAKHSSLYRATPGCIAICNWWWGFRPHHNYILIGHRIQHQSTVGYRRQSVIGLQYNIHCNIHWMPTKNTRNVPVVGTAFLLSIRNIVLSKPSICPQLVSKLVESLLYTIITRAGALTHWMPFINRHVVVNLIYLILSVYVIPFTRTVSFNITTNVSVFIHVKQLFSLINGMPMKTRQGRHLAL